ncbi:MAG: 4-phosphopantetheinyl transferase family protein [Oceanococcus sp.]|nr:MAG: 4-phosphopantetheinyl transferase family protein [Oceanococcus sp.]
MIGNDVVDLADPETRQLHPRFDRRILSESELQRLKRSADPHRLRWTLWAAKEASYKRGRKLMPDLAFSPCLFETHIMDSADIVVKHPRFSSKVQIDVTNDYVHAVALPLDDGSTNLAEAAADLKLAVIRSPQDAKSSTSLQIRQFAQQSLAKHLQVHQQHTRIITRQKIPYLTDADQNILGDLSLSHHGQFLSLAFQPCPLRTTLA